MIASTLPTTQQLAAYHGARLQERLQHTVRQHRLQRSIRILEARGYFPAVSGPSRQAE